MTKSVNTFESEWTEDGAVVKVRGFPNMELHCPTCDAILPRNVEHRCGNRALHPGRKKKEQP